MNVLVIGAFCPHVFASFLDVAHKNNKVDVFESTYLTWHYTMREGSTDAAGINKHDPNNKWLEPSCIAL